MSPNVRRRSLWHVRPTKSHIILCICAAWSETSLSAWRHFASLAIQNAHSEDSDQTAQMRRLIWIFAGRTCPEIRFLTLRLKWLCMLIYHFGVRITSYLSFILIFFSEFVDLYFKVFRYLERFEYENWNAIFLSRIEKDMWKYPGYYENTPIQIHVYWQFYSQNIFRLKNMTFFIFLLKIDYQ